MKFKNGARVVLKEHKLDSDMNLDIGATGKILEVSGEPSQPYYVEWDKYKNHPGWWVAEECIRPYKLVLENK